MKKILISVLLVFTVIFNFLSAQQGWIKNFPSTTGMLVRDIEPSQDGNYFLAIHAFKGLGSNMEPGRYISKVNNEGDILWIKDYKLFSNSPGIEQHAETDFINSSDGGVLVHTGIVDSSSNSYQNYWFKLDSNGNVEWEAEYDYGSLNSTIASSDGGYYLSGNNWTGSNPVIIDSSFTYIRKLDSDFNEIWTYKQNWSYLTDSRYYVWEMAETSSGNIIITGWYRKITNPQTQASTDLDFAIIINNNGNEIWRNDLGERSRSKYINCTPDGGFILSDAFSDNNINAERFQIKLDSSGIILWEKQILPSIPSSDLQLTSVTQVDDGLIYTGTSYNPLLIVSHSILLKTDFEGNVIWQKRFKNNLLANAGIHLTNTNDNGFLGVGTSRPPNIQVNNNPPYIFSQWYLFKADSLGQVYANSIEGIVTKDDLMNCETDYNELGIGGWIVTAKKDNNIFYGLTNIYGQYEIALDTGTYDVKVHPPNSLWQPCENNIEINVDSASIIQNFPNDIVVECPLLAVSTSFPIARPCFDNNRYFVNYCNEGTALATDVYIEIVMDSYLTYDSSSINLTAQNGDTLVFDLGDIGIGQCDDFYIDFEIDCDATLGESVCIDAHIYPDSFCLPFDSLWNGAFIEVSVECQDSVIKFILENTGTGNMSSPSTYIVIEDAILLIQNNFQLLAGQRDSFSIPTNGSTYTFIAEQVPFAPGDPFPQAVTEGCGLDDFGNFSVGYTNQFSLGSGVPFEDSDCSFLSSSFDPNDKQGFPLGYGDEHFIRPNTDLEYLIRFQNTGTDTAFTVVLRDTIAPELNLASINVGASSHPYTWRIYGENILEFTFNTIMLPDSNINEPASHGFVEFKIKQQKDLPEGTVINNKAAIYFDFNEPVITNETFHTIGLEFITVNLQNPVSEQTRIKVYPNPLHDFAIFEMEKEIKDGLIEIYDITGRLAWRQKINGKQFEIQRNNLESGIYFYKISDEGKAINSGKINVN